MLDRLENLVRRNKSEDDKGFSLVELAVVVVIIGILVAIAIPVFGNLQNQAKVSAANAAVANAASMSASLWAETPSLTSDLVEAELEGTLLTDDVTGFTVAGDSVSNFCITAATTLTGVDTKGPGC